MHVDLTLDDYELSEEIHADIKLEVEYEWKSYNPGRWEDEPPSGGGPECCEVKVTSAKLIDSEGHESVADEATVKLLQAKIEEEMQDWINERLKGPEEDYDPETPW